MLCLPDTPYFGAVERLQFVEQRDIGFLRGLNPDRFMPSPA
ncbi:hypothetical protein BURMUCGD2M_2574 [Burkholderia multivorans CGD2M]|uniref:Uncharacterized protein n=1 Tax=Burkholderia multivorans CGD2 TaxID=513052 RepID=B9BX67_9BURK|nr:hypothetical protein BURMUCGD2_2487 [Burkholderia multivorans CGD2]EEE11169.1 hypothetical protein BURMUCGD2M_2574 [Burkholderia multivorans CGD2M]